MNHFRIDSICDDGQKVGFVLCSTLPLTFDDVIRIKIGCYFYYFIVRYREYNNNQYKHEIEEVGNCLKYAFNRRLISSADVLNAKAEVVTDEELKKRALVIN